MEKYKNYIAALKTKDEEAFSFIYHETKSSVYSIIIAIIKDQSLAEDVMQDTYIKMITYIHSYKDNTNFRNWLLTIAKNTALDYYRKRSKEVLIDSNENQNLFTEKENKPLLSRQSEKLLNLLDNDEREVVLLRIVDDIKFKDISEVVDKPLGTVLWLYQKGINKMKKYKGGI